MKTLKMPKGSAVTADNFCKIMIDFAIKTPSLIKSIVHTELDFIDGIISEKERFETMLFLILDIYEDLAFAYADGSIAQLYSFVEGPEANRIQVLNIPMSCDILN